MSNPSDRNSNPTRSVTLNVLLAAKSLYHAPGPVNALRRLIFPGNGPRSEMPNSELRGAKLAGRGTVKPVKRFGPEFLQLRKRLHQSNSSLCRRSTEHYIQCRLDPFVGEGLKNVIYGMLLEC